MARRKLKSSSTFHRGKSREFKVWVDVHATGYGSGNAQGNAKAFEACASVGKRPGRSYCALAKNPRKAAGGALKKLGAATASRGGAFAGLKGK